ncbi:MAG TPA: tetratricopeptide repeat protein, partial [Spongiibacteraceae bacterium]|nr:tetratricopeptide repeat protein [Spongiibacteraceae bacterium]
LNAYKLGQNDQAIDFISRALALRPDYAEAHHSLGDALRAQRQFARASTSYRQALALNSQLAETHYQLGSVCALQNDFAAAMTCFQQTLAIEPGHIDALSNLGTLLARRGDSDAAIDCYHKALALQPQQVNTLCNLGTVLQRLHRIDEAIDCYEKVLTLQPDRADVYCNLGVILQQQGKVDAAILSLQRALSLQPNYAAAHDNLGSALMQQNKWAEAGNSFHAALALEPARADILCNLGAVLAHRDLFDDAITYFRRALSLQPDYALAHNNLGSALMSQGKFAEARAAFERGLELEPDNTSTSHLLTSLRGETTETAPQAYVKCLFDDFADQFESRLVGDLKYRAPNLIRTAIDGTAKRSDKFEHALDLGCGTGLAGEHVADIVNEIRGVDLSPKMLEVAERKGIYSNLYAEDIVEYLERSEREFPHYDLVLAADVFVYVGNLEPIFKGIRKVFAAGGLFVFSVEDLPEGTYKLLTSGRYAHSATYIRELAANYGFSIVRCGKLELRKERETIIMGNIFVLTQ